MANPVIAPELHPTPESEAKQLLALQGERGLKGAIDVLMRECSDYTMTVLFDRELNLEESILNEHFTV